MLENERIIVDRGGIDPGIAALMQNANKGFDPAALMAMMNNGNGMFGGNGGWWWIFIIVLFWMWGGWGGNGFGRGNQAETNSDFARLAAMGNQNNNTDLLMQAINGNKDAINTLSTNLNCDVKSIDTALCSIQNAIGKVGGEVGFSAERVINAVNAGDCNVIKAISDCCCTTQRSIDSVNLNLTQMNADNRLSICQQTNTLQNAITSGFNNLSSENATRFNILGSKIDAQTQIINDKFCQLEMREMQNKIDALRDEKNALQTSAINDCKVKKESVLKYDEEMRRCEDILKLLNTTPDITTNVTKDFKELDELKAEVKELKQLLQNVTTVRPEVNEKVPQAEEKQIEI